MKTSDRIIAFTCLLFALGGGLSEVGGQILEYGFNSAGSKQPGTGTTAATLEVKGSTGSSVDLIMGAGTGVSGRLDDRALDFTSVSPTGSGPLVLGGNIESLNGLTSFTISGWAKDGMKPSGYSAILIRNYQFGGSTGFALTLTGTQLSLRIGDEIIYGSGNFDFTSSEWKFWAVTFDGAAKEVIFYFGGTEGTIAASVKATTKTSTGVTSANLVIGNNEQGTFGFHGVLDNVRIHGSALDAAELTAMRNVDVIPEPSQIALAIGGVIGLFALNRRGRRAQ